MKPRGQNIAEWLAVKVSRGAVEIDLRHSRGDIVETLEFEENESPDALTERIFLAAEEDAKGMTGPQVYWASVRRAGEKDVLGRKSLTVDGEPFEKNQSSEAPDTWGLTSQAMRHAEGMAKIFAQGMDRAYSLVARENERLTAMQNERDRLEIERMAMHRQLAQDVANQRVEEAKTLAQSKRDAWFMRQAELILPLFASGITQGKDQPNWSQEGEILLTLMTKLSEEQVMRIAAVFDPAGRALIAAMGKGELHASYQPMAIQRLMSSLDERSWKQIASILTTDEQRKLFDSLFFVRRHGIEFASQVEPGELKSGAPLGAPLYGALPSAQPNGTVVPPPGEKPS